MVLGFAERLAVGAGIVVQEGGLVAPLLHVLLVHPPVQVTHELLLQTSGEVQDVQDG